ncbi:HER126Cp [Eremothecium sinecaudum]|uniref:HER126Cp n=1 Tax=Eremothecium sinecaudum TaxID=45286 RepID=A0A120K2G0_9SACH|nr:HER126Cp [Eremothecium sinecaudum]AMD21405.1 HER126Cp [Eremothecium sinecaudum]
MVIKKRPAGWAKRQSRSFKCSGYGNCEMSFTRAEHLARHIRKHTGEKPFQCEVCSRYFSRIDNLKQHRESVHAMGSRRGEHGTVRSTGMSRKFSSSSLSSSSSSSSLSSALLLASMPSLATIASSSEVSTASPRSLSPHENVERPGTAAAATVAATKASNRPVLPPIFVGNPVLDTYAPLQREPAPMCGERADTHLRDLQFNAAATENSIRSMRMTSAASKFSTTPPAVTKRYNTGTHVGRISVSSMLSWGYDSTV